MLMIPTFQDGSAVRVPPPKSPLKTPPGKDIYSSTINHKNSLSFYNNTMNPPLEIYLNLFLLKYYQ